LLKLREPSCVGDGNIGVLPTIILQLDPAKLSNPDADLRYVLTDLLITRLNGLLHDD